MQPVLAVTQGLLLGADQSPGTVSDFTPYPGHGSNLGHVTLAQPVLQTKTACHIDDKPTQATNNQSEQREFDSRCRRSQIPSCQGAQSLENYKRQKTQQHGLINSSTAKRTTQKGQPSEADCVAMTA
jgi:hypothetical protein